MPIELTTAHRDLWNWCRAKNFSGYDPYDGLNSSLFQRTPLRNSRAARLAWTQLFKRSPINLRKFAGVPAERNAKGVALFALAALADYRRHPVKEAEIEARELLDDLLDMKLKGFQGAAWGYNFDWQSRAFFAPKGTPTIVPTAFAARALCEAAEVFERDAYLPFARSACDFILNDLKRTAETSDELCFSYSPLDQTRVFNASLLAGETLATVGRILREESLCDMAMRTARYVIRRQGEDGAWSYGDAGYQSWSDSFHTAYILMSLSRIGDAVSASEGIDGADQFRDQMDNSLRRGYEFWIDRFFLQNGWPKYFPDRLYPADAHSAASAIVTLAELRGRIPGTMILAEQVAEWTIANLRNSRGFFNYQKHRFHVNRIPYMRWSQAWMAYALATLNEVKSKN